jgi:hypothetical protein
MNDETSLTKSSTERLLDASAAFDSAKQRWRTAYNLWDLALKQFAAVKHAFRGLCYEKGILFETYALCRRQYYLLKDMRHEARWIGIDVGVSRVGDLKEAKDDMEIAKKEWKAASKRVEEVWNDVCARVTRDEWWAADVLLVASLECIDAGNSIVLALLHCLCEEVTKGIYMSKGSCASIILEIRNL